MKRFILSAAAFAVFSVSAMHAQTFETIRVHFNEPVQASGNSLPAGDYTITMAKTNGDVPLLRFTSDQGTSVFVFASRDLRAADEPAPRTDVILDKSGEAAQVSRIQIEGSLTDLVLMPGTTAPAR